MSGVLVIGMLAHNEAAGIAGTIASLAGQSILDPGRAAALGLDRVEVMIVPNGSTDDTAAVAEAALSALPESVGASVVTLAEPGKSNAWNRFVHELSQPDATLLALMDADIEFGSADVLERMVARLAEEADRDVATDRPVKDYRGKRLSLFDRLSRRVSGQIGGGGLCGQLYVARAAVLRRIWLPIGLPVEDGFLYAMLGSDGFTSPSGREAITFVAEAHHLYEPLTGPAAYVRHEARIIVGSVINAWLFDELWTAGRDGGHAGEWVRRRNAEDPRWVETLCAAKAREGGRWVIGGAFFWGRLAPLRDQPPVRRLRRLPMAIAATIASLPAIVRANAILRRPAASRHW